MSHSVILIIFAAFLFVQVQCSPEIITQSSPLTQSVGNTVYMLCQIKDLTNEVVTWEFLQHNNKIISRGSKLMVDEVNHYKIELLQDDTKGAPVSYLLTIFSLQTTDHGSYKCSVSGTNESLTYDLAVNQAPTLPPPPAQHNYNFTDCCVKEKVSASCMPVCDPFTFNIPPDFNPLISCGLDLPKLLKCGSDKKNHAPCCKRRNLPDMCLDFCVGQVPTDLDDKHLICMNNTFDILMCYEEGQKILPGPPTAVSTIAINTPIGFVVNWKPPTKNNKLVKGYYIHYRLSADTVFRTSQKIDPKKSSSTIGNLLPSKMYSVYMSAFSDYGSSQPSEIITQSTLGGSVPIETDLDINACCQKSKMPQKCKDSLCKVDAFTNLDPVVILSCFGYIDESLRCVTGQRNHTACCQRNGISDRCLGFCSGDLPPLNNSLSECMIRLPLIEACVVEGMATIPGPPVNVTLTKVSQNMATVEWMPPTSTANVSQYLVSYVEHSHADEMASTRITTNETTITLTGLIPNTEYDLKIISVNEVGQSLETPNIGFRTYDVTPTGTTSTTPFPGPDLPYNATVCCSKKGVSKKCLKLCDYSFIINAASVDLFTLASECSNDFPTVIECGSDGRDHSFCCKQRGIPDSCLHVCKGDMKDTDILCAFQAPTISRCFQEGVVILPRTPTNVYLGDTASHSISVTWSPPMGGPPVEHYDVYYESLSLGKDKMFQRTNSTTYIIQNLESGYDYTVYVVAGNSEGVSVPSPALKVFLPPDDHEFICSDDFTKKPNMGVDPLTVLASKRLVNTTVDICKQQCLNMSFHDQCTGFLYYLSPRNSCLLLFGKYGHQISVNSADFYSRDCDFEQIMLEKPNITGRITWKSQEECCVHHNVSDSCMDHCKTGNAISSPQLCENDFSTVIACASDGRNHSACCQAAGVPRPCLPFCWGAVMDKDHPVTQLCLSYTRMFVTCFTEGTRTLPSVPKKFMAKEIGSTYIILSWVAPDKNCNGADTGTCTYVVQWTPGIHLKQSVRGTTFNLTNLKPETEYMISVSAANTFGSSLPTPIVKVRTTQANAFAVNFYIQPGRVIDSGESVKLICAVYGAPDATVSMMFKTKEISKLREYVISNASKADSGMYSCTVKKTPQDQNPVVKTLHLPVRYEPEIKGAYGDQVEPDAGKTAYLKCIFIGSPMAINWLKDGKSLPAGYPTMTHAVFQVDSSLEETLEIHNVRAEMYGRYDCIGTNKFGEAQGHVELKNDYITPSPGPKPTLPTTGTGDVTECCNKGGIQGVCMELCDFKLDFAKIAEDKYDSCLQFVPVYASCAADKKDHTKCCDSRSVKDYCKPFCSGSTPDLSDTVKLLTCVEEAVDIVECIESGRVNIPYAPINVVAKQIHDKIQVHWDAPKTGSATVEKYKIYYKSNLLGAKKYTITTEKTIHSYDIKLSRVTDGVNYRVWVTASNEYGDSLESEQKVVQITEFPPQAPKDLIGRADGNIIHLQWTAPEYTDNIAKYIVKYHLPRENSIPLEMVVPDTTMNKATLMSLKLQTSYEIWVVGQTKKNQEGMKSNSITVTTGKTVSVKDKSTGNQDEGGKGGVVAVIVIIVLLLVGALVVGFIFYRRRNRHRFQEAVTFENPQYGSSHDSKIKISGLPADSSEDNPFGYSPLQEDRDEHHYSSPMLDVDQVEFKPRK